MGTIVERPMVLPTTKNTNRVVLPLDEINDSETSSFVHIPPRIIVDNSTHIRVSKSLFNDISPGNPSSSECCSCAFSSVKRGHLSCLKKVPKEHLVQVDVENRTMLHVAVKYGHLDVIDYLLKEASHLIDVESNTKDTPVLVAATAGKPDVLERLLTGPMKLCQLRATHRDINGTSCLMAAVARHDNETALWLLRRFGRQLAMLPNNCEMLPIHVAAAKGNIEFLRIVITYDPIMINCLDKYGCSPCTYAAQNGSLNCLRFMIKKGRADMSTLTNKGQSLLHVSALSGHPLIVRWLLNRTDSDAILYPTYDKANAVHCAAFGGCVDVAKLLLGLWSKKRRETILSSVDVRGNTPLHLAAINNQCNMVKYLIEVGSNPKLVNLAGQSAEEIAIRRGYLDVANVPSYDTDEWRGEALAAIEEIDKVLDALGH